MVKKYALALLLVFATVAATACNTATQATLTGSRPTLPLATQPTDTPKPISGNIQPPLSADERKGAGVATEFVQEVMVGQEARARSLIEPGYSATIANLYDALGLHENPSGGYQVIPDHREGDSLVFAVVLDYPHRQLRGGVTVIPSTQGWQVTRIVAAL